MKGKRPMSPFQAGILALVVIAVATYFGFTKSNPFSNPFKLNAVFQTAANLKKNSPVRIAGVEVGKVTKVEPFPQDNGAKGFAKVQMTIRSMGLPIHDDAEIKVRPRIFLEGNFFLDLHPGSPSAPTVDSGYTVGMSHTSAPVQFADVLSALQSDTRHDLQTFLQEYSSALDHGGAAGFDQSIKYWADAYRNGALANDATLGQDRTHDLHRVLSGQQRTSAALDQDEAALKGLVTNFNITAGALAREDVPLEQSVPALRDTLAVATPALRNVNAALPTLRAFSREALPGVRSSNPTLAASMPFITQARLLVRPSELRGTAAVLRRYIPSFVRLNRVSVGLLAENRQLSACTNKVLVPFVESRVPDPDFGPVNGQKARSALQHGLPGLAGESRNSDANTQFFHAASVMSGPKVRPGPPPDEGNQPPPHRPDVPCETQQPPNLEAPGGPTTSFPLLTPTSAERVRPATGVSRPRSARARSAAISELQRSMLKVERLIQAGQRKSLKENKGR
jgi:phospholipid/cholesterol/gamma-HCH transport system substrate-binding protein